MACIHTCKTPPLKKKKSCIRQCGVNRMLYYNEYTDMPSIKQVVSISVAKWMYRNNVTFKQEIVKFPVIVSNRLHKNLKNRRKFEVRLRVFLILKPHTAPSDSKLHKHSSNVNYCTIYKWNCTNMWKVAKRGMLHSMPSGCEISRKLHSHFGNYKFTTKRFVRLTAIIILIFDWPWINNPHGSRATPFY